MCRYFTEDLLNQRHYITIDLFGYVSEHLSIILNGLLFDKLKLMHVVFGNKGKLFSSLRPPYDFTLTKIQIIPRLLKS